MERLCTGMLLAPPACDELSRKDGHPHSLQWRHYERDGAPNDCRRIDCNCLLKILFRQIKGNIKAPRHWPLWGEFTVENNLHWLIMEYIF